MFGIDVSAKWLNTDTYATVVESEVPFVYLSAHMHSHRRSYGHSHDLRKPTLVGLVNLDDAELGL